MNGDPAPLPEENQFDPMLKAKWLEALRSGRYLQGVQALHPSPLTWCCLGVLCDVLDPTGWDGRRWTDRVAFATHTSELPILTERRLGLPHGITGNLMCMNDEDRMSFAEIADYIEANL